MKDAIYIIFIVIILVGLFLVRVMVEDGKTKHVSTLEQQKNAEAALRESVVIHSLLYVTEEGNVAEEFIKHVGDITTWQEKIASNKWSEELLALQFEVVSKYVDSEKLNYQLLIPYLVKMYSKGYGTERDRKLGFYYHKKAQRLRVKEKQN